MKHLTPSSEDNIKMQHVLAVSSLHVWRLASVAGELTFWKVESNWPFTAFLLWGVECSVWVN